MTDSATGRVERGLGIRQCRAMVDANFARATGSRRHIDRAMMNGEGPVPLSVMGKNAGRERYLSVEEVRALFAGRRLPRAYPSTPPEPAAMNVSAAERAANFHRRMAKTLTLSRLVSVYEDEYR